MKQYRFVAAAALCAVSMGVYSVMPCAVTQENVAQSQRAEDIEELARYLEEDYSYSEENRAAAERHMARLRAEGESYSPAEFYLAVRRMAALADNGHTFVLAWPVFDEFSTVPLRLFWFGDELRVVRTPEELSHLLGERITKISDYSVARVMDVMGQYAGGNEVFKRNFATTPMLLAPELLAAAGLEVEPDALTIAFTDTHGVEQFVRVAAEPPNGDNFSSAAWQHLVWPDAKPWRYLVAHKVGGEKRDWRTIGPADADQPIYLQQPDAPFFFLPDIGNGMAYLNLRRNRDGSEISMRDYLNGISARLAELRPQHLILDMRHNSGGDLNTTVNFMLGVHDLIAPDGLVFSITGPGTFSAGIYSAYFAKNAHPDRTIIVGERPADREVFWSEGGSPIRLPQTDYLGVFARQMHALADGCHEDICHIPADDRRSMSIGSFDPQIMARVTFADYQAGRDPVLQAIFDHLAK